MKYDMIKKSGALQEGISSNFRKLSEPVKDKTFSLSLSSRVSKLMDMDTPRPMKRLPAPHSPEAQICNPVSKQKSHSILEAFRLLKPRPKESIVASGLLQEKHGMFFYTVPEGQRVLVTDTYGCSEIVAGPKRISRWGKRIQSLQQHIAYPGEFLIVKCRNGAQNHIPGPCQEWLDPRIHSQIEKNDALQIAGKEAVVVYTKNDEGRLIRRIIVGPALFIPTPGEWLHTFSWHGSKDEQYKKTPGGLVFQKLWLMPDQMYHDVESVCTADDVTITIKLMIFFELNNVEKMIEGTHDPIGDFINATSSDVIEVVKHYSLDEFKIHSEKLNDLASYPQLLHRAGQVGYTIHKIVYRGYTTTVEALQQMQNKAIETRTKLKLERETEEQAQKLLDYKQKCEAERAVQIRLEEKAREQHILETAKLRHKQQIELKEHENQITLQQLEKSQAQQLQYFSQLRQMGVELTNYLTQGRADKVIELRNASSHITPHIHMEESNEKNKPKTDSRLTL